MIPKDALADIITAIEPLAEKTARDIEPLIEFELITAAAFQYFRQKGCGAVVLEVGIGGRIDATNVIKSAKASVITDISYDHMNVLGDTLGKNSLREVRHNKAARRHDNEPLAAR
jgi:dihydrofolate synthase/folylpolyglutamate synthase